MYENETIRFVVGRATPGGDKISIAVKSLFPDGSPWSAQGDGLEVGDKVTCDFINPEDGAWLSLTGDVVEVPLPVTPMRIEFSPIDNNVQTESIPLPQTDTFHGGSRMYAVDVDQLEIEKKSDAASEADKLGNLPEMEVGLILSLDQKDGPAFAVAPKGSEEPIGKVTLKAITENLLVAMMLTGQKIPPMPKSVSDSLDLPESFVVPASSPFGRADVGAGARGVDEMLAAIFGGGK